MKTLLCLGLSLIGLFAGAVSASAVENEARVITTRSVRVAAIRESSDSAPWYVIQQAFGNCLSASLPLPGGHSMPVRVLSADSATVADELLKGEYDAVLVLGERLPSNLRVGGLYSVRAVSEVGIPVRVFHFVVCTDDNATVDVLTAAFEKATTSASFQETMARATALRVVADSRR